MTSRGHHGLLLQHSMLWTPSNLPAAPSIWVDDNSALTVVSGAASAWSNSRGSAGGSFNNGTAADRPTVSFGALNNRRVLVFDGSSDSLIGSGGAINSVMRNTGQGWTFAVAKQNVATGANKQIFQYATPTGTTRFGVDAGTGSGAWLIGARRTDAMGAATLTDASTHNDTSWHIGYFHVNWSAATARIVTDGGTPTDSGSFLTAGLTSNTDSLRVVIGANAALTAWGNVSIAAVLGSSGSLPSDDDRQRLEGWAAWRYGLVGNLPIGHPYKAAPPLL